MDAAFEKNAGSHRRQASNRKDRGRHISLWVIYVQLVKTKWNKASWPDFERISKLDQKTGTMLASQDKEFVGHKNPKTGWYIKVSQEKAIEELS